MTVLFMGSEMGSFIPSDSTVIETTSSVQYNASFSRAAIKIPLPTAYATTPAFAATSDGWLHFQHIMGTDGADADYRTALELMSGGVPYFRVRTQNSTLWRLEYWNGVSWALAGSAFTADLGALQNVDVHWDNSAAGSVSIYLAGTLRATTGSINLSAIPGISHVRFYGRAGTNTERFFNQVIVATVSTIGWRLLTYYPSANGANTGFTGGYTAIDEAIYSDADYASAATAGLKSTFSLTGAAPLPANYKVQAVGVYARARKTGGGLTGLKLALRAGGTDYSSATQTLDFAYGAHGAIWEDNPSTGVDFLTTEISGLQAGFEAAA